MTVVYKISMLLFIQFELSNHVELVFVRISRTLLIGSFRRMFRHKVLGAESLEFYNICAGFCRSLNQLEC
ncbi:hypothetical protein DesfrDRAFT_2398 [Solidesulfovibrio fructosivorans JJ]]|uniref:Uncharacterized protein n=1 Tax=Solidesulfovibrio fructosivorans JJ] TaxID=596151 RepID=E1JXP9_SOLFR|nr:hypothetical protein DesfrDRAFT_2398 [Solidesulfovibrio fructosivorans JJ]]